MNIASSKESDLLKIFTKQKSIAVMEDGTIKIIRGITGVRDGRVTFTIPKDAAGEKISHIDIMPDLMTASAGDDGYIVTIGGIHEGNFLTYFKERDDTRYITNFNMIPVYGIKKKNACILGIVTGMATDVKTVTGVRNGVYYTYPRFCLEGDEAHEDITVEYVSLHDAGYSEMAAYYRNYQLARGACVLLKERVKGNPALKKAVEAVEIRIRHAWKPGPCTELHQTPQKQPPLKVACDFDKVSDIIGEFKRQGLGKAEICLVGWNTGGHAGRFPQLFPVEEKLGGETKLRKVISEAKEAGYNIVCFTNNTCAFECADSWNPDHIVKNKDGSYKTGQKDCGGLKYYLCPKPAYEDYVAADLPKVAELGFTGVHYIDIITAVPAVKCYNEKHPVNRKETVDMYNKMGLLSRKLFGGFQSEGPYDFMSGCIDSIVYVTIKGSERLGSKPVFDETIPFWQLVYHGIIMSNPDSSTVNYTLKGAAERLKLLETGGRPLMYYYSKFGEKMNWMGDTDLTYENEEDLVKGVAAVKRAYDEYKDLVYLQYEFMEKHEKTADGVFRTTYSDGTTVKVDYNTGDFEINKPASMTLK
ncbi:MAG: DUF5696 domain-containing protein [Eubacteriales bacterium]|nr:DUF5696 domain-containing protein [Eubacteriales bacterium]